MSKTPSGRTNAASTRAAKLDDRAFRSTYMTQHLRGFLADQIRALRGTMSQTEFGRLIGKPQSVVSRLEDEDYGKLGLQTLIDIATKLDIAVVVRFVDYPHFLQMTSDFSDTAAAPLPYEATRPVQSDSRSATEAALLKKPGRAVGHASRQRPNRQKRMRA